MSHLALVGNSNGGQGGRPPVLRGKYSLEEVDKALDYIATIARNGLPEGGAKGRLASCDRVLQHYRWTKEYSLRKAMWRAEQMRLDPVNLLREIMGDDARLLDWMDKTRPLVEAKLQRERAAKLLTNGVNHDGRDGEGAGPEGHGDSR